MAACLIVAVTGLIDTKRARNLWSKNKGRFALYLSYLGMMLTFGAAEGLLVSVAAYYGVEVLRWGKAKLAT